MEILTSNVDFRQNKLQSAQRGRETPKRLECYERSGTRNLEMNSFDGWRGGDRGQPREKKGIVEIHVAKMWWGTDTVGEGAETDVRPALLRQLQRLQARKCRYEARQSIRGVRESPIGYVVQFKMGYNLKGTREGCGHNTEDGESP
jgi:hypothetical protein